MSNDTQSTEAAATKPLRTRKRWLLLLAGSFALMGVAYGVYWTLALRYVQSTDDAYVSGNVVQITPQISGTVIAIGADDTPLVMAGQTLVQLDQADARIALDQADAQLAKSVREVRNLFATTGQLQAAVTMRQSDLAKATDDLARRDRLASSGAISAEEQHHARDAVTSAQAALLAAQQQLEASRVRVDRTRVDNHPDVLNAAAHVRDAYLTYARTALPAPVSGFVAKRAVQLGQRVSPGSPLMAIVPLDQVWVDANFKEPQLADMRGGQPVTLKADIYGRSVKYHGKVVGFGAGTGSAFALLPAQNATGNWIKIVQRVAVRIAEHPLQVALSMQVDVETHQRTGDRLPQLTQNTPAYTTAVFHSLDEIADGRVKAIIAANEAGPQLTRAQTEQAAVRRAELVAEHMKSTGQNRAKLL